MSYEGKTIKVLAHSPQGKRVVTGQVSQHKIILKDKTTFDFDDQDITNIWCAGLFTSRYKIGVEWRVGTQKAVHRALLNDEGQEITKDYLPALTQADTKKYIEQQVFNASNSAKDLIKTWQFWVLLIVIIAIAVMSALSLFGVHLNATTTTTIIQNVTAPTVTPLPFNP